MSRRGAIVGHFKYRPHAGGESINIPVRFVTHERGDDKKEWTESAEFTVDIEKPFEIKLASTDIDLLRSVVFEKLNKSFEDSWKRFLYIKVPQSYKPVTGDGIEFEFVYEECRIGIVDGKECFIMGHWCKADRIEPGRPREGLHNDTMYALLLDTPENRKAIKSFVERLKELRKRLQAFLTGDVESKLKMAQFSLPLLPGPRRKSVTVTKVRKQ